MSPLDTHLRDTLHEHGGDVPGAGIGFADVERRARTMHRRRVALATAGTAAVTALAVVGGLTLTGNTGHDAVRVPYAGEGGTPSAQSPPPPSATATGPARGETDDRYLAWPARAGRGATAADFTDDDVLWAGELPTGSFVTIRQHPVDGRIRAFARVTPLKGLPFNYDGAVVSPGTTKQVSFVLPGNEYPYVLVLGAPATGQILYAPDGESFSPVDTTDGWALFKRTGPGPGSTDADRILVEDGDGGDLYLGPIDTGPSEPDV